MAFSVINTTSKASPDGNEVDTDAISTIGADLIVAIGSWYIQAPTFIDNQGNTYIPLTEQLNGFGGKTSLFYCEAPTTSASHTFRLSSGGGIYSWVAIIALSGRKISGSFDQESGAFNNSASSIQPGSITPSDNNAIWIVGGTAHVFGTEGGIDTVDSPFSSNFLSYQYVTGQSVGGILAWEIQTSASARNPTISTPSNDCINANGATFLAETGGSSGNPWYLYAQQRRQ